MSDELFPTLSEPINGAEAEHPRELPRPRRERWQPLRSGLINIFKYDDEEFLFEDGRLLLRGNNGAGKSRILALQLPFLLDGEMASHRVEPDGDPAKRMEWNLLMNRHENRLGYTWIEFGRRDAEGVEHFLTLGCGLHARKGTGIAPQGRWFFVTRQRIGETLKLVSENQIPLGRERLEAALGDAGTVYRSAREYRIAVDEALFGLGSRYNALIDLLLQLRKPQIMRDFKEEDLSRLLSEALPPLSNRLIENVSVSFRSLESDRQQITDLTEARRGVETFLHGYRHYVRVAVRRRAADVRAAHSHYETVQRELKRIAEETERNAAELSATEAAEQEASAHLAGAREGERTLLGSPEMRSAEDLRQAGETRDERIAQHTRAEEEARRAEATRDHRSAERAETEAFAARRSEEATTRRAALERTLSALNAPEALLQPENAADSRSAEATRKKVERFMSDHDRGIGLIRELNRTLEESTRKVEREKTRFEMERENLARFEEEESRLREEQTRILDELITAVCAWEAILTLLPIEKGHDWRAEMDGWMAIPEGPTPLARRIDEAYHEAVDALKESRLQHVARLGEAEAALEEHQTALDRLRAGEQAIPPTPYTRDTDARMNRPGAPLWKLCGFRDEVSADERAGFEAALESAGLLDAWVTPDGTLLDPAAHDIFLMKGNAQPGAGLDRVLRVEIDAADPVASSVQPDVVELILRSIGCSDNEGATWVSSEGRWCHGLLRGAWQKPEAEYIGHAARETSRRRRIAEMEAQLRELESVVSQLRSDLAEIDASLPQLRAERDSAPSSSALEKSIHLLESAERASAGARVRLDEVDRALSQARDEERAHRERRDRDAADLGLAAWKEPDALRQFEALLSEARQCAAALWPAWEALIHARAAFDQAAAREAEAQTVLEQSLLRLADARRLMAEATARYETLHATVGASVNEIMRQLDETRQRIAQLEAEVKAAADKREKLRIEKAVLLNDQQRQEMALSEHEQARAHAVARLRLFAEKRLLEEAGEGLQPEKIDLAPNPAVELARRIEQKLTDVAAGDDAWKRAQSGIQQQFSELNDQLGMRGYHPQAELIDDGVFSVTCAFHGQPRTMIALRHSLSEEIASREQMLSSKEREVIENHLIGEVATELQTLIRAGEDWVHTANKELDCRPASSGIKLHFTWELDPEAPEGLAAARKQLLKMTAAWSPLERESIGRFLQDRINAERAADETASWQDHLRRALDYRAWHRFGIMRYQDGDWKRLTKRTYGTGSGGEKAMTLTVPQFAAAAAHYRSAGPHAPRLILLDEVFVGIDAPTRGRLMGLLDSFDLDFVMTSEREWGCYATIPALAICQLASRPEIPAVHVTRWVWNGRTLARHDGNGA